MAALNGSIQPNLPKFDGNKFGCWCIQMKVLFGYQEILEIVENGFANPRENVCNSSTTRSLAREQEEGSEGVVSHLSNC